MEKVCQICGNIGFTVGLMTCRRCNKASEHIYCMRDKLSTVSRVWYCEECEERNSLVNNETQDVSKRQKTTVDFSDMEKLRSPSVQNITHNYNEERLNNITCDARKQIGAERLTLQNGSTQTADNYTVTPVVHRLSDKNFKNPLTHATSAMAAKGSEIEMPCEEATLLDNGTSDTPYHENGQRSIMPPLISGTTSNKIYRVGSSRAIQGYVDGVYNTLLKCVNKNLGDRKDEMTQKIKGSGMQGKVMPSLLVIVPYGEPQNAYSPQDCWKGNFEVLDVAHSVTSHYNAIRAHFPSKVSPKVYEMQNSLPEKLNFKLLPRGDVWPKLFQLEPPDKDDVGLYFFPLELGRSKEKYDRFVERLTSRNLALRTCVSGFYLVIFTSKLLAVDCQRVNPVPYLWGVFQHVKQKKVNQLKEAASSSCSAGTSYNCAPQHVPSEIPAVEVDMVVDMEVDMEGGKEIGVLDVRSPKVRVVSAFQGPDSRDFIRTPVADLFPLKKVDSSIHADVHSGFCELEPPGILNPSASKQPSKPLEPTSRKVTSLIHPDVSPGFSKLGSPELSKLSTPKHRSTSLCAFLKKATTPTHLNVSPGFFELEPPGIPNPSASRQQSNPPEPTSRNVTSLIRPDVPPGFSKLGSPELSKLPTLKHQNISPCAFPKKTTSPTHLNVPPGFCKLEPPPGFSNLASKEHIISLEATSKKAESLIQPDVSPNCCKLGPPGFPTMPTTKHQRDCVAITPRSNERLTQAKHHQVERNTHYSNKLKEDDKLQSLRSNSLLTTEEKKAELEQADYEKQVTVKVEVKQERDGL